MIEIEGVQYDVTTRMTPMEQHHVVRRLLPVLAASGPVIATIIDEEVPKAMALKMIVESVGPISLSIAKIDDADYERVLNACLLCVTRLDSDDRWHPIVKREGSRVLRMYQEIDAGMELRLAGEVLKANLSGFFGHLFGGRASTTSAPEAAAAPS